MTLKQWHEARGKAWAAVMLECWRSGMSGFDCLTISDESMEIWDAEHPSPWPDSRASFSVL